jgi:phospholipase C
MEMRDKIENVVLLMLENRSLDNVLGWLYANDTPSHFKGTDQTSPYNGLKESMGISEGAVGATGTSVPAQPLRVTGWDPNEAYPNVNQQLFGSEAHPTNANPPVNTKAPMEGFGYDFTTKSHWNRGPKNPDQQHQIQEAYTPDQLPILNGLAKGYAVSDAWFSSVPTETNPNRAFSLCGTSLGCLDDGSFFPHPQQYKTRTIWEALPGGANGPSWGIYYHDNNYVSTGECYTEWTFPNLLNVRMPWNDISPISVFYQKAKDQQLPNFTYIEPSWGYGWGKDDGSGFNCPGSEFWPGKQGNDYHPPTWMGPGEALVNNVYTALTANIEVWKKTLLIITFDEHGGTYDHVDPEWGAVEPGDGLYGPDGFQFNRYGVRVPTLLISPWIQEKTVFRSGSPDPNLKYDHTSIIATLLKWQGVDPTQAGLGDRVAQAPTFDAVLSDELRQDVPQYTLPSGYADQGAACWQNLGESQIPIGVARGLLSQQGTPEEIMARTKRFVEMQKLGAK